MKPNRVNLTMTLRDAIVLMACIGQMYESEAAGMLTEADAETVDRLLARLRGLIERSKRNRGAKWLSE